MSNEFDASRLRMLAVDLNGTDGAILERIAAQLDSDAKRDAQYDALQAIGKGAYDSVAEMVAALECDYDRLEELKEERGGENHAQWMADNPSDAEELAELEEAAGECKDREEAEQRIHEDPLSVEVRSGWHSPGGDNTPEEFTILLGTGGPATRIIGELDEHGEPTRARLQAQDWGTPWTDYRGGDSETLLTYCRCFYFGEG